MTQTEAKCHGHSVQKVRVETDGQTVDIRTDGRTEAIVLAPMRSVKTKPLPYCVHIIVHYCETLCRREQF